MSTSSTHLSCHYQPSKTAIQCWTRRSCCTSWSNVGVIRLIQWHCITVLINLYSKAGVPQSRLYGLVYARIRPFRSRLEASWAGNDTGHMRDNDSDGNLASSSCKWASQPCFCRWIPWHCKQQERPRNSQSTFTSPSLTLWKETPD